MIVLSLLVLLSIFIAPLLREHGLRSERSTLAMMTTEIGTLLHLDIASNWFRSALVGSAAVGVLVVLLYMSVQLLGAILGLLT